jgi:hypothetical protein
MRRPRVYARCRFRFQYGTGGFSENGLSPGVSVPWPGKTYENRVYVLLMSSKQRLKVCVACQRGDAAARAATMFPVQFRAHAADSETD